MAAIRTKFYHLGNHHLVLTLGIPLGKLAPMKKLIAFLETQPQGYKTELAKAMDRPASYFSRQLAGDRAFSVDDCIAIEKHTGGKVRCEDILPETDWQYLRESKAA